jgi:hypothetical protein
MDNIGYCVLSIRDIESLLFQAKTESKEWYNGKINKNSTIILNFKISKDNEDKSYLMLKNRI